MTYLIYSLSKFANYCRDNNYDELIETINKYLIIQNAHNEDEINLRLLFNNEDGKYYLRAITSTSSYKDFSINFSVFVALIALNEYVEKTKSEIFIDYYSVTDSTLYLSFAFIEEVLVTNNIKLTFNLVLENDEIKRNSVSFNGVFKLIFQKENKISEIYIKPNGIKTQKTSSSVDLLSYKHSGSADKVFDKIQELPELIEFFINQVKEDAVKISKLKNQIK